MTAMLGALGSVSERPKEAVCKTAAEATVVRTHPGPLLSKGPGQEASPARAFFIASFNASRSGRDEPAVDDRKTLQPGGGAERGAGQHPVGGAVGQAADDVEVLPGAPVDCPHDRAVE